MAETPHQPDASRSSVDELEAVDPTIQLARLVETGDVEDLQRFVYDQPVGEMARALSRLDEEDRSKLINLVPAECGAYLVEELNAGQASELLLAVSPARAAEIVEPLPSDAQADLIGELDDEDAEAILAKLDPEEASEVRRLTSYDPETAGGLMATEYLAFFQNMSVSEVVDDLRTNAARYQEYDVQYVYIIGKTGELKGVVRLRDLVLTPGDVKIEQIMIQTPVFVQDDADLPSLEQFFDAQYYQAAPVIDAEGRLVGVVRRAAVEEAIGEASSQALLRFGGIIAGEESRSMPTWSRALRRLAFLAPNIVLNLIAASVVAFYEPTIAKVTALAIFLPILSDMSGCSGNQAVAVSMRELALGLVKPSEVFRTLWKEVTVGAINGILLGTLLGTIAYVMRGDQFVWIGIVVGAALATNSVIAVAIGGTVPLILKSLGIDPAMASGPILTTVTDLCGFFFALFLATQFLS
ncbi:magnesium transporter [Mucisphaera sp.]|uniref:magnesium transporter n=1 Tax=Mucisphaera sp. TaxID=2913024 RepID=UPI003D113BB9